MASEPNHWTCPNCETVRESRYCEACGEQPLGPHDLTLRDLLTKFGQSLSSIDGKAARTFPALIARPGFLTLAHLRGQRRVFIGPLKVFLIANAIFFAVQSATHTNILSSTLGSHLYQQDWKEFARSVVARHLRDTGLSLADYMPIFDTAVVFYAKTLIILMALSFAPIAGLLFASRHRPLGANVVFSLHVHAFILLLFCVSLGIGELNLVMGGQGLVSPSLDLGLSIFNLTAAAAYLYLAIGPVYGATGFARIAKAALLAVVLAATVIGYRFLIFLITITFT
jgi:hypothetical protein